MRLKFRPDPILSVITLVMLAILISLGTWQYQRLQWKTALLDELETSSNAAPFKSVQSVLSAIENGEPVDFRRIQLRGEYGEIDEPFRIYQGYKGDIGWRLFYPVRTADFQVFAGFDTIADEAKLPSNPSGAVELAGYVRIVRDGYQPKFDSNPEANRWYGFNPMPETYDWADKVSGAINTAFYVDVSKGVKDAETLKPKMPELRNNHFDYMLTWFGLALVLLVIYFIVHKKNGRLSWC